MIKKRISHIFTLSYSPAHSFDLNKVDYTNMLWLPVFLSLLGFSSSLERIKRYSLPSEDTIPDEIEEQTVADLEYLIDTGIKPDRLRSFAANEYLVTDTFRAGYRQLRDNTICTLCKAAARVLIGYRRMGGSKEDATYAANQVCVGAKIASKRVCKGAIDLNIDIFLYIIDNKQDISPSNVCSILAQPYGCKESLSQSRKNKWSVQIPPKLQELPHSILQSTGEPIRILHFTDIHYDDIYKHGGNAVCGEPLCCGSNQGEATSPENQAGYWGDYRNCDTPWHSVLDLMKQFKSKKYDMVYYTGDIINHRVWETSREKNTISIRKLNALFKENFGNTSFYPILGNHEPNPLDTFSENITESELSTQWLFDISAEDWSHWLPESSLSTIKKGGYYTTLVKPGFRIIGLNSNVGYTFNWWLLYNDQDPYGQLQWLADTLAEAEKSGEIVHILSHVPTGDDTCLIKWSHEYNRIIERFHHVIATQINGHTHYDEFNMYYSQEDSSKPISIAYNGGSVTTYSNLNPNFRILTVNPQNLKIEDYDEFIFNITEANLHGSSLDPVWYKLYSFKEAWGITDMTNLTQIDQIIKNIASNRNAFNQYWNFKVREGDPYMKEGCDDECQEINICRLVITEFGNNKKCDEVLQNSFLSKPKSIFKF